MRKDYHEAVDELTEDHANGELTDLEFNEAMDLLADEYNMPRWVWL